MKQRINRTQEEQRRLTFINYFTAVCVTSLTIFGIIHLLQGNFASGLIEIAFACLGCLNIFLLRFHNKVSWAASGVLSLMILVLMFLLTTGGLGNTGIYWFFTFPALAFFLKGKVEAIYWLVLLMIVSALLLFICELGIVSVAYTSASFRQLAASFIAVSLLIYFYQFITEEDSEELEINKHELAKTVERLRNEVTEQNINQDKIQGQNLDLERTKLAMLNLLEDLEIEKTKVMLARDRIDIILHSIGDAVFAVDSDLKITVFNEVCEKLTGYTAAEAMGKPYHEIIKFCYEDTKKPNTEFIRKSIENGLVTEMGNHTLLIDRSGKEIPVSDSAAPLRDKDGKVTGCVVVFRDITHEREVDRAKTEFVSLASHQLLTPLSAINWYSEMLSSGDAGKLNEQQQEFVKEITDGNKRMVDLVHSLLNVSRIDLGTFAIEPTPTNITELADSVAKELEVLLNAKKLKLNKDYDTEIPILNVDPKLTRIIFQNLLSNAVKYSHPEGEISLEIKKREADVQIIVRDHGFGIPEAQQPKIFTKLFRADNARKSDVDGTGLGLYIVKSILNEGGGAIRFESAEGKGTTFYVELPLTGMKRKEGNRELS